MFTEAQIKQAHSKVKSGADFPAYVADSCDIASFKAGLKAHQQGQTDYLTFITMSAECGVEKWAVDTEKMSCTYYDKSGNEILVEQIPNN